MPLSVLLRRARAIHIRFFVSLSFVVILIFFYSYFYGIRFSVESIDPSFGSFLRFIDGKKRKFQ